MPVLEGDCLGMSPRREFFRPSSFRRPGRNPGKGVASFPDGGPDALAIHSIGLESTPALAGPLGYRSTAGTA